MRVRKKEMYLMKKPLFLFAIIALLCFTHPLMAATFLETNFWAPPDLIRENVASDPNHITVQYERYGTFTGLPAGMTRIETSLDNAVGIDPKLNLVANSLLVVGTWHTMHKKNYNVKTYINITQRLDSCLIKTTDGLTTKRGTVLYGISSYQDIYDDSGTLVASGSQYKSIQICGNIQNKIGWRFDDMINHFLLPITITTYDEKGNPLAVTQEAFIPVFADKTTFNR